MSVDVTPPRVKKVHYLENAFESKFLSPVFKRGWGIATSPRIHFDFVPADFDEQVMQAVEEYLSTVEKMHLDETEGSSASGKTAAKVLDESLYNFFAEIPVLYKALKEVFQIPAVTENKRGVLEFLKIDFNALENLFTWAQNNDKTSTEDRFLLDCLLLDGFQNHFYKTSILKRRTAAKKKNICVKKELLYRLFLHSIKLPDGEDITVKLLKKVTSLRFLKSGLIISIEQDKAALAETICAKFIEWFGLLSSPDTREDSFFKDVLEAINHQITHKQSYQVWRGLRLESS